MFTYIDPTVRERLIEQGTLFRIDQDGNRVDMDAATGNGQTISILGPIPLPLEHRRGSHFQVQWFACVRNTRTRQDPAARRRTARAESAGGVRDRSRRRWR